MKEMKDKFTQVWPTYYERKLHLTKGKYERDFILLGISGPTNGGKNFCLTKINFLNMISDITCIYK